MKKRIFALLLVLVMVLSLSLISCDDEEAPPPPPPVIPTVKLPVYFDAQESQASLSVSATDISNLSHDAYYENVSLYSGNYIEDSETGLASEDFTLISEKTGLSIGWTCYSNYTDETKPSGEQYTDYYINQNYMYPVSERFILVSLERIDGNYDHMVFDQCMKCLVSIENSEDAYINISYDYAGSLRLSDKDVFFLTVDQKVYRVLRDYVGYTTELFLDKEEKNISLYTLMSFSYDKYTGLYTKKSGSTITVLNSDFTLQFSKSFDEILDGNTRISPLNNGNYLVTYTVSLLEDATEYDVLAYGYKSNVTNYIYNPTEDSLKEIELSFNGSITPASRVEGFSDSEVTNLIYEPTIINDDKTLTDEQRILGLNDNLEIVKYFEEDQLGSYHTFSNGAKYYSNGYTRYLVDNAGEKVAEIPNDIRYNDKFFYDEFAIYDTSLNVLYEYRKAGREVRTVYSESFLFTADETNEETLETTNFVLWTGKDSEKIIGNDVDYNTGKLDFINDAGYYIREYDEEKDNYSYSFYNSNGALGTTVKDVEYIYTNGYADYGYYFELKLDSAQVSYVGDGIIFVFCPFN